MYEQILHYLHELGDYDLQMKLWTGGMLPGFWSDFGEAIEGLFSDTGLSVELDRGSTGFPSELVERLLDIDQLAREVDVSAPPEELINSEVMFLIRENAARAEALLRTHAASN